MTRCPFIGGAEISAPIGAQRRHRIVTNRRCAKRGPPGWCAHRNQRFLAHWHVVCSAIIGEKNKQEDMLLWHDLLTKLRNLPCRDWREFPIRRSRCTLVSTRGTSKIQTCLPSRSWK